MRMQIHVGQSQVISPQMIASIAVLQCGAQELGEYLEEMSYENPMMELREPERTDVAPISCSITEKYRWLAAGDRQNRTYYTDGERDSIDQYLRDDQEESLCGFVKEQILTLDVSPETRFAMETVAELLDARGLFTGTVEEIAGTAKCSEETAADALARVRELEPAGVAAENVQQALLRQLKDKPVARQLIEEHFSSLGSWSDQRIARAMGVSEEAVRAARAWIAAANPHPGNGFAGREDIRYVTPDLSIMEQDGVLTVTAEERYLPAVHINAEYLHMLETETDPELQAYLKGKLRQVEQVLGDIDRRKSTLQRCGEVIAVRQAAFFRGESLRKLTLRDVAEELGLHESTISRAVKNKYVECARGMFPMSAFFCRDVGQNAGLSRSGIQDRMIRILDGEDPRKPLSDEKIAEELQKAHIILSRRAVAKYRMELGIPAASGRKRK